MGCTKRDYIPARVPTKTAPPRGASLGLLGANLLIDIELDCPAEHRTPSLQIGLHPRIAGELVAVELDRLVGLVFDLLHDPPRVVHVLQQANALAAEGGDERPAG